jgi:hypothetical protein
VAAGEADLAWRKTSMVFFREKAGEAISESAKAKNPSKSLRGSKIAK